MSYQWVHIIEKMQKTFENHPPKLRLLIHYENLRSNTNEELRRIYDGIGIKINEEELKKLVTRYSFENIPDNEKGKGKQRRSATPGKWKENFTDKEQKMMEEIMRSKLLELKYY